MRCYHVEAEVCELRPGRDNHPRPPPHPASRVDPLAGEGAEEGPWNQSQLPQVCDFTGLKLFAQVCWDCRPEVGEEPTSSQGKSQWEKVGWQG